MSPVEDLPPFQLALSEHQLRQIWQRIKLIHPHLTYNCDQDIDQEFNHLWDLLIDAGVPEVKTPFSDDWEFEEHLAWILAARPKPAVPVGTHPVDQPWRTGTHYNIHVYAGDTPVCTALTPEFAQRIVEDHEARLEA
jgi:hypothetical protein